MTSVISLATCGSRHCRSRGSAREKFIRGVSANHQQRAALTSESAICFTCCFYLRRYPERTCALPICRTGKPDCSAERTHPCLCCWLRNKTPSLYARRSILMAVPPQKLFSLHLGMPYSSRNFLNVVWTEDQHMAIAVAVAENLRLAKVSRRCG